MNGRRAAGALESAVLSALWAADHALTPAETLAAMDADLAYTTVMTTLTRLHAKGLVSRERSGRAYAYSPLLDVADAAATEMRALLDRGGDRVDVLARFVGNLESEDKKVLSALLGKRRQGKAS